MNLVRQSLGLDSAHSSSVMRRHWISQRLPPMMRLSMQVLGLQLSRPLCEVEKLTIPPTHWHSTVCKSVGQWFCCLKTKQISVCLPANQDMPTHKGETCFFAGSSALVCTPEAKCSSYQCPEGFGEKQDAEFEVCASKPCTAADTVKCCTATPPKREGQGGA